MTSNDDSNEQGNDTAAFQVGDRVRFYRHSNTLEGTVQVFWPGGYVDIVTDDGFTPSVYYRDLTLISRATPAPTPAQTEGIDAALEAFEKWDPMMEIWERPIVVCLCGSTRFSEAFRDANLRETLAGHIVLSIGCDMRSDTEIFGGMPQSELDEIKRRLDDLHKRKIDLADEILVLNVGGYIGESTASEIAYAQAHGKTIRYLETTGGLPTQPGETPDSEPATPAPATHLATRAVEVVRGLLHQAESQIDNGTSGALTMALLVMALNTLADAVERLAAHNEPAPHQA